MKAKYLGLCLISFCCFSLVNGICANENGLVIAFAGISGSGKTTMAKTLADEFPFKCLTEPEEDLWPEACKNLYGHFSMWMAFRHLWLPQQFQAQKLKREKEIVFLDTYFIKIIGYELEDPSMSWLYPHDDAYFNVFKEICRLDLQSLPDPDCIVYFDVTYEDWIKLLATRDRAWDKTPGFLESYHETRRAIYEAVYRLCAERNIQLVYFQQKFGNIHEQAHRLRETLVQERILSPNSNLAQNK